VSFECRDLDDALREGAAETLAAARAHAAGCESCRERLLAWDAVSEAAVSLRRDWDSPELWPTISSRLETESRRRRLPVAIAGARGWRLAALAASLLLVAGAAAYLALGPSRPSPERALLERRLLTERALAQVERSEQDYVASIDELAKLAEPRLDQPSTPLLASYREKLQMLDAAIAECRSQIEGNRFNAHLRRELLSIYQEKQTTLRRLLEERT